LPKLIGLRFAANILQIQKLVYLRMFQNVMASFYTSQHEIKSFC